MIASRSSTPLRSFLEECLAHPVELRETSWPHGEASVWAVEHAGETVAFLKQHRRRSKFETELFAYRNYVPSLQPFAPHLIAIHAAEPAALLISAVAGRVVEESAWPADTEYRMHVRAAQLLRRLHEIPVAPSEREALEHSARESLENWLGRAVGYFPAAVLDWARREVEAGIAESPPICVCHKDFSPRNWVAPPDGPLALIDFERTRVDYQCLDWSRLWMREWQRRPELQAAFFEGYGPLAGSWESTMRRLMVLYTVGGVVWATEHQDGEFAREQREVLERLLRLSEQDQ
jgi:thiamine kinase-like enzyme